jgi:hypothetical protein
LITWRLITKERLKGLTSRWWKSGDEAERLVPDFGTMLPRLL